MAENVAEALLQRGGSTRRTVTGLVVQGGGMRGIYSMAALSALEEAGLGNAFTHVFASSAGAINGAYMLAGQAHLAVTVYLDDISNRKFVNFARLRRIVDIDYLVDGVLKREKLLDVARVMTSGTELHIILTDAVSGEAVVVSNRDGTLDLMEALRATAAMPILYNKLVAVGSGHFIDGGLRDAVPVQRAIEAGCTEIVVVLTREPSFRRRRPSFLMRCVEAPFLRGYSEATRELILAEDDLFNRNMAIIMEPALVNFEGRITLVYPSDMRRMVSRTTSNRARLLECALMARDDMRRALGLPEVHDSPWPSAQP
jgi:predicted patatin/cPLA2 family phospholipase